MTKAQWNVFGILVLIIAIDVSFSANTRAFFKAFAPGQFLTSGLPGKSEMQLLVFWLLGFAALLAITDVAPRAGMLLAVVLLITVLFAHSDPLISWLSDTTKSLATPPTPKAEPPVSKKSTPPIKKS